MLRLSQALADQISAHATETYPLECCGLTVAREDGSGWVAEAVHPSENLSDNPQTRFEVDMRLRLTLQKDLRGTGSAVIGHYHSHPDGPPAPSAKDLEQAWEDRLVWVIVGVEGGNSTLKAYEYRDDEKAFLPLAVEAT